MQILTSDRPGFLSPHEWNHFTRTCSTGHLLQSWTWGELKGQFGWQPLRIALCEAGQMVAGVQVLFRRLPTGLLTAAYVPRGPMGTPPLLSFPELHQACHRHRAVSLLVEPDWEDSTEHGCWLSSHGFRPCGQTIQPRRSVVLDLRLAEDDLLAQMKAKTRYNIRLAQRKGVQVKHGSGTDIPLFYELLRLTSQRDGFGIHTQCYYSLAWNLFAGQDAAALLFAEYEGRTLAAAMVFAWGPRAYYMYGASSDDERHRMPTYLVQWSAMQWARSKGCQSYDLWGIPDVDDSAIGADVEAAEQTGPLSTGMGGLYRFKRGFGGRVVRYVATYERAYQPVLARLLQMVWSHRAP